MSGKRLLSLLSKQLSARSFNYGSRLVQFQPTCSFSSSSTRGEKWRPYIVENVSDIIWPEEGIGGLPEMPSGPPGSEDLGKDGVTRQTKRKVESRGPELVHTELYHKQFGIVALDGGRLFQTHFKLIHDVVNRHMNEKRFAVWRVDRPWLPFTRKRSGSRLGGGKGKFKEFITPVRNGRIVLEVGGIITTPEAQSFMADIAGRLPFVAKFVTQDDLVAEKEEQERIQRENINPYDWEFLMKWNMQNCSSFLSFYDYASKGKTRI